MDIEQARIGGINYYGFSGTDKPYTIYYDETNNCRSFYLKGDYFNAPLEPFVLAGVFTESAHQYLDLTPLKKSLKLQANAPEIKSKQIFHGGFEKMIASPRFERFIDFLLQRDFGVHYCVSDLLYFSAVDIIDTIIDTNFPDYNILGPHYKSHLTRVFREQIKETTLLFKKYNYPAINPENKDSFFFKLIGMVNKSKVLAPIEQRTFMEILKLGVLLPSAPLIEQSSKQPKQPTEKLIDDFAPFYMNALTFFQNAHHVFDHEFTIQALFQSKNFYTNTLSQRNVTFADSKTENGIQLSDVTACIFGKLFSYLSRASLSDIKRLKNHSLQTQRNLQLLTEIILKSQQKSTAFFSNIVCDFDRFKLNYLLDPKPQMIYHRPLPAILRDNAKTRTD